MQKKEPLNKKTLKKAALFLFGEVLSPKQLQVLGTFLTAMVVPVSLEDDSIRDTLFTE